MKKYILVFVALLGMTGLAYANTKITQMPSGGTTQSNDLLPVVRGGQNFKTNFPNPGAAPAGPLGAFQTYATATTFIGLLPPAAQTSISSGLQVDPRDPQFGSNTCTGYYPISASTLISGGTGYAVNDTFTIPNTVLKGANPAIGHVTAVSSGIVTTYALDSGGGGWNVAGVAGSTFATTATSGAGTGLTIRVDSAGTAGNDDTAAFAAAGIYAANQGGALMVPNGCWIANLILPSGIAMVGQGWAPSYGFDYNNTGSTRPKMFVVGSPKYVINTSTAFEQAYVGFEINAFIAGGPQVCIGSDSSVGGTYNGAANWAYQMSFKGCDVGIGQHDGETGAMQWKVFNSDFVPGFGTLQAGASGNFNDSVFVGNSFAGNGSATGIRCSGLCSGGMRIIGNRFEFQKRGVVLISGGGALMIGNQFDHHAGCQLQTAGAAGFNLIVGNTFRGGGIAGSLTVVNAADNGGGLIRLTVDSDMAADFGGTPTSGLTTGDIADVQGVVGCPNATGTFTITVVDSTHIDLQGSTFAGSPTPSTGFVSVRGKDADICLGATTTGPQVGYNNFTGNTFINSSNNVAHSPSPSYVMEVTTTGANNDHISFTNGTAIYQNLAGAPTVYSPQYGYSVSFAHWINGVAPHYTIQNMMGTTAFSTDNPSLGYSLSTNGALGLSTTAPAAGTILDMLNATTTITSSIGLPGGTTANRPPTGIAGMERYNSTILGVEAYFGGTWNKYGSGNAAGTTQSGIDALANLTTGTNNTAIGYQSLTANTIGGKNTALGYQAGKTVTTGGSNVVIGPAVGSTTLTVGSNNILIGTTSAIDTTTTGSSNYINIGGIYQGNSSTQTVVLGGTTATVGSGGSDCGTSPVIAGDDSVGRIQVGASANGGICTLIFANTKVTKPICTCNNESSSIHGCNALGTTTTSSALTATTSFAPGEFIGYHCLGYQQ